MPRAPDRDGVNAQLSRMNGRLTVDDYTDAKVRETIAKADRVEQIIAKDAGRLLEADVVVPSLCRLIVDIKNRILAAPAAAAPVANPANPRAARAAFAKYLHEALSSFDQATIERALRGDKRD